MKKIDTSDWSKIIVDIGTEHFINDETLDSKEKFESFCKKNGYKLISFKQGTNPLCK